MYTNDQLHNLEERELISIILKLQKRLIDVTPCEYKSGLVHNYHFASNELLKLSRDRMFGSGLILTITDLKGAPKVKPVMVKDGFSVATINSLLDDMQYSYKSAIEFKPTEQRLKIK